MKKYYNYIVRISFVISAICILIYLLYTIYIKLHPSIIVTDNMLTTLKVLLIIALISLFIGLFMILLRKIKVLNSSEVVVKKEVHKEDKIIKTDNKKVINNKSNVVISEKVKEEKVVVKKESDKKMLYTRCPECNELISEKAALCPHCGILFDREVIRVLKKYDSKKVKEEKSYNVISALINVFIIIIVVILIILTTNILIDKYNKNNRNFNIEEKQK